MAHFRGSAPALLRHGQIHADGQHLDITECRAFFVPAPRLGITHWRVKRWYGADEDYFARVVRELYWGHVLPYELEIRGRVANFDLIANERDRVAAHGHCAFTFFCHLHPSERRLDGFRNACGAQLS